MRSFTNISVVEYIFLIKLETNLGYYSANAVIQLSNQLLFISNRDFSIKIHLHCEQCKSIKPLNYKYKRMHAQNLCCALPRLLLETKTSCNITIIKSALVSVVFKTIPYSVNEDVSSLLIFIA